MEARANKVFLPQSYEQYLIQKKKTNRASIGSRASFGLDAPSAPSNLDIVKSPVLVQSRTSNPDKLFLESASNREQDESKEVRIVEKTTYSEYKNLLGDFENNKFHQMLKKMEQQFESLKEQTPLKPIEVNSILKKIQIQSLENIRKIETEMLLPFGRRNPESLDEMLCFNKFFVILNKQKRYKIYQNCQLMRFDAGDIIYRENEPNEFMYIVVKGCVKQYETKTTSYQDNVQVNFLSYYEGSNFGEAPLVGDSMKGKRYNTTQATEETYLLLLANNFYKELITNSAEDDFERKIEALLETSIFRDTSKMFVTPILPTLQKHILPYGTVLIRQGEEVRNLYFVAEGNLDVMMLDRAKRNVKHLNIQEKPKSFYLKKSGPTKAEAKKKSYSIHNTFYFPENTHNNRKEFLYGNKKLIDSDEPLLEYNEQIIFNTLRFGDFFGGKSFLQEPERERRALSSENFDSSIRANLSVVSSSPKTTVYSIDEKKFFSLSDSFQKMIVEGILENKYFDEQNIGSKVQNEREWKKYSEKLVEDVIRAKRQKSNSFRI